MSLTDLFRPKTLKTGDVLGKRGKTFRYYSTENLSVGSSDVVVPQSGHLGTTISTITHAGSTFPQRKFRRGSSNQSYNFSTYRRSPKKFITGSSYIGDWNILGFAGEGTYRFPHGVFYDGNFNRNGEFHGIGSLIFPNGQRIRGLWKNGHLLKDATFIFSCGEVLDELHKYCLMPDRRFHIEIQNDLNAAGQEYLTHSEIPQKLPPGTYDIGDGIYYPFTERIMIPVRMTLPRFGPNPEHFTNESYRRINLLSECCQLEKGEINELDKLHTPSLTIEGEECREIPSWLKRDWIIKHCRNAEDEPVGYIPHFYQTWMAGRRREVHDMVEEDHTIIANFLIPEKVSAQQEERQVPFASFIRKSSYAEWKLRATSNSKKMIDLRRQSMKRV